MFDFLSPTTAGFVMFLGAVPTVAIIYWLRNDWQKPAVLWFQFAMASGMLWSISFGLLAVVESPGIRLVATNFLLVAIPSSAIFYFLFCYEFTFKKSPPNALFLLFVPVVLLFVLAWSNPQNLIYTTDPGLTGNIAINEGPIQPVVNIGLGYLLVVLSAGMVLGELLNTPHRGGKIQALVILLSIGVVTVLSAIKILQLPPWYFDPVPIGWTVSGLLFAASIKRYQFLQLSSAPWEQITNEVQDPIIVFDAANVVLDANDTATERLGISAGMTGRDLEKQHLQLEPLVADETVSTVEIQRQNKTSFFDIQSSAFEYGRRAAGRFVVLRDITHRKTAQQELEATKERYRRLYQESSDYVVIVDEDQTVIDATQGIENVLGYTPTEAIGGPMLEYVHPGDEQRVINAYSEVVSNPTAELNVEFRARTADGEYRWLEGRGRNFLDDPLLNGLLVNVREITARKHAEQAIAETKEYYRRVLEQSLDYTLVIDDSDVITDVTPGVKDMSGFGPDEVVGQNAFEAVHPDDRDRVHDSFATAGENPDTVINIEYRVKLRDGSYNWVEARGRSHLDDPLLEGIILNIRDISQRKQREQELAETTARLQQKNEQLERLAQVVSHDLQTPLSTAQKLTQLLRADLAETKPGPAIEQSLQDLEATHERLRAFADHLPRLARESTDVETPTDCELDRIAEAAWSMVDTDGLELEIESTCRLQADPERLQRVFENLFQNTAVHAASDATTVRVGAFENGLYIEDDGPGIRPEQRTELFEYGMGTGSGSGFGLAIVRTVVEARGWSITLAERYTEGARFEIETGG